MWHDTNFRFGITEQGDAGLNFTWVQHMHAVAAAVVMSKTASDELIDELLKYKDKVIYHATCTGLGGTRLETNVPSVSEKFLHIKKLISYGFPVSQIVLRVDPLFPRQWIKTINEICNIDYVLKLKNILKMGQDLGIKRVRYSYLKLYDYVLSSLQQISDKFIIDENWIPDYRDEIQLPMLNDSFEYESCNEQYVPYAHQIGCISDKDLKILKLDIPYKCRPIEKTIIEKPFCKCASNKLELISNNDFKCECDCSYCYWKIREIDLRSDTKIYGYFK